MQGKYNEKHNKVLYSHGREVVKEKWCELNSIFDIPWGKK